MFFFPALPSFSAILYVFIWHNASIAHPLPPALGTSKRSIEEGGVIEKTKLFFRD